jgi:hypothetical protein
MELALIIVMGVNGLHARFIRLFNFFVSVYGTFDVKNNIIIVNCFVK